MCFSLQADLVAGALLLPLGALSLREVRRPREVLFASLPLLFAAHQLIESLVWAGSTGDVPAGLARVAAVAYVIFALPVLPTLVPLAVLLIEPAGRRWRVVPFVALGAVVTAYLTWTLIAHGVRTEVRDHAIIYHVGLQNAEIWTVLYIAAAMGAAVASGYRSIVAFGLLNLVGLTVVAVTYREAFASVWCVYAALTSLLVLVHMVRRRSLVPLDDDELDDDEMVAA